MVRSAGDRMRRVEVVPLDGPKRARIPVSRLLQLLELLQAVLHQRYAKLLRDARQ